MKISSPNVARDVAEISFTVTAKADLAAIDEYGAEQFGDDVSDEYSRGFVQAFDLLRDHPLAGAAHPELGKNIRCLMHRRHRIFYRADNNVVLVIRIIHHARDAKRELRRARK